MRITDAHLAGIFHIVNGHVTIEYEGRDERSLGSAVLRIRAPSISAGTGFVRAGDLFISQSYASGGWQERTPLLDVAVLEGSVNIRLKQQPQNQEEKDLLSEKYLPGIAKSSKGGSIITFNSLGDNPFNYGPK